MSAISTLAAQQADFMASVLDDECALPAGWTARHAAGLAIYRNNYRSALVEALLDTYERTARWVGEDAFRRAAAHHLITHPPSSWTLDDAGEGFDATLRELFADDPEVAELAWLEWAMHSAFTAADAAPLDAAGFADATTAFDEADWAGMRCDLLPGTQLAAMANDLPMLWRGFEGGAELSQDFALADPAACIVWREGHRPVFMAIGKVEAEAISAALSGANYGEICALLVERLGEEAAMAEAGAMLARWLHNGLLAGVRR